MNDRRKTAAKSLNAFFGDGPAKDLSPAMRAALAGLKAAAKPRDTRVADMLLAGTYRYVDFPGAEPQLVEVDWVLGECQARFHDMEPEDAGLILHPQDMAGTFERVR